MRALVVNEAPFGRLGEYVNRFLEVEPWLRRVSASLVKTISDASPDLIVTFGMNPALRVGALAQLRANISCPIVCVWPDPLTNWGLNDQTRLTQIDLVASYSSSLIPSFRRLGAREVIWLPFAADAGGEDGPADLPIEPHVSFIGNWRPEREIALRALADYDVRIWGPGWSKSARRAPVIARMWQRRPIFDEEFARAVRSSAVNLNFIHQANPAAPNMRLFELMAAGGLQLASHCSEISSIFRHGEHIYYFERGSDLPATVAQLLLDPGIANMVRDAGHRAVMSGHRYVDRARQLLEFFDLPTNQEPTGADPAAPPPTTQA